MSLPLVVLLALAYLGSAAHFVLVQHRTCLAHGELVHEGRESSVDAPAPASFADERITDAESPESEHPSDVHCAQASLRRVLPPPVEVSAWVPAPLPPQRAWVAEREHVEPPVAWLHLAPKLSPPQA